MPSKVTDQFQKIPQQYEEMVATSGASFKFLGEALNEDAIRKVPLSSKVVLRRAGGDEDFTRDPVNEAITWANDTFRILTPYLKIRPDAIFETINEPNPTVRDAQNHLDRPASIELAKKLNAYQVACAQRLHTLGVQSVGAYQFSVGQPPCRDFDGDDTLWPYLLDGIRESEYLFLHEYSAPRMRDRGTAYCLRYRHVLTELAIFGVKPRIGLTEVGIDRGVIAGQLGGYRDPQNNTTIDDYCSDLRWYADELAKDSAVAFAHVFLCGRSDDKWRTFDVADEDTDRAKFIQFLSYTPLVIPIPPMTDLWYPNAERHPTDKMFPASQTLPTRAVVLHIAQGSYAGAIGWLSNSTINPNSSAHFVIAKDGRVAQLVPLNRSAWANGSVAQPSWVDLIPNVNPNLYTVSIEHEGLYTDARTPAMESALTALLKWISAQISIVYTPHRTLIGHCEIDSVARANCPGPNVNYETIAANANGTGVITVTTPKERLEHAWQSTNIVYNPDAAYPKIAQKMGLGRPVGNEYNYTGAGGSRVKGQGFNDAFLESPEEDVLSAKAYDWLTGEVYVPSVTPPPTPTTKRLTTADLPPQFGIVVKPYASAKGEKFFGLVGAGNFKSGPENGTQTTLVAANEQGSPVIGYSLTHAYDEANHKSETFPSPQVGVILGTGSYYNPPAQGNDHFYVSKGPAQAGVWPTPYPSDVVIAGMPNGEHFEATYTWQLMTG